MKKERIYSEVLAMLNDRVDYKSITLLEVARRCDMGKSTIYEYFSSKDEMIFNSMIYYLNNMVKFFSESFNVTDFYGSLKTYIRAVMISMKGNYWMVMPWTFTDNYSSFLIEEDAKVVDNMLHKCQKIIYTLFTTILEKGQEEGEIGEVVESNVKFAFNALILSITEKMDKNLDVTSDDVEKFISDLCDCIVKQMK